MKRFVIMFMLNIFFSNVYAQDSSTSLSARQVMEIVRAYHPIAKQAAILIKKANADITIAKGEFDPLFYNSNAQKTFDGTTYYQYNRPELKLPTWFGMEIYAGLEKLSGQRTDPTETIGKTSYIGISIPLAKNLLMDKRRAALQKAKIFAEASEAERRSMLNDLLLDAMKSYWYWMQHYQVYKILNDAVQVNETRVQLVKTAFGLGERPAIDTIEALSQLQNFQVLKEKAWMEFQNAGLELSVFLWRQDDTPVVLPAGVLPADESLLLSVSTASLPVLSELLDVAKRNHPGLLLYDFKLEALEVEKKLRFQSLLPEVKFRYNQLGKGYNLLKTTTRPLFENNFQHGLAISFPLRLSEGRGEYRKAKLNIIDMQLGLDLKRVQVENEVRKYFNELAALQKQVQVQEGVYKNYLTLQRGEDVRFRAGESSLFLVNARETKTLEALQKLQELRTKYLITVNSLQWSVGMLLP